MFRCRIVSLKYISFVIKNVIVSKETHYQSLLNDVYIVKGISSQSLCVSSKRCLCYIWCRFDARHMQLEFISSSISLTSLKTHPAQIVILDTPETAENFLSVCPVYALACQHFLESLTHIWIDVFNRPTTLQAILHVSSSIAIASTLLPIVLTYLKQTNRFR